MVLEKNQVGSCFASFVGGALRSPLGVSFNMVVLSSLLQGQPGSPGLKGESGDLGPQVTALISDS